MPLTTFFKSVPAWSLALITLGLGVGGRVAATHEAPLTASKTATFLAHTTPTAPSTPAAPNSHRQPYHSDPHSGGHRGSGHGADHHHSTLEIPAGQPVPTIEVIAHRDPRRGWNLEIRTTHFRFAPEEVNQANQPNAGHGHLYINGELGQRVYGPWLHLPNLAPGRNEITVSLNSNSHEILTHNGQPIAATVVVMVTP